MTTHGDAEAVVLSSLTRLMVQWSSLALQARYAQEVGVEIDAGDVRSLYILGLGGPRRASDLADELRLTRPTMSKQVARLTAAGLISKVPDPADGRATIITLSDSGARAFTALVDRGLALVHFVMADWQPEERHQLAALVTRFASASDMIAPASDPFPGGASTREDSRREAPPTSDGTSAGITPDDLETRDRP